MSLPSSASRRTAAAVNCFAHRADAEFRLRRDRRFLRDIREAEATLKDNLPIPRDEHGEATVTFRHLAQLRIGPLVRHVFRVNAQERECQGEQESGAERSEEGHGGLAKGWRDVSEWRSFSKQNDLTNALPAISFSPPFVSFV